MFRGELDEAYTRPFPGSDFFTSEQARHINAALDFACEFDNLHGKPLDKTIKISAAQRRLIMRANAQVVFQTALALGETIKGDEIMRILEVGHPREMLPIATRSHLFERS